MKSSIQMLAIYVMILLIAPQCSPFVIRRAFQIKSFSGPIPLRFFRMTAKKLDDDTLNFIKNSRIPASHQMNNSAKLNGLLLVLLNQGIVFAIAFFLQLFTKIDPLQMETAAFDSFSILEGTAFGAVLGGFGLLFDRIPLSSIQTIRKDTQIYVLKLLGNSDSPQDTAQATFISLTVSFAAGLTEEALFRGELLPFFSQWVSSHTPLAQSWAQFPDLISLFVTSLIFGLLHFPTFGLGAFVETALGAIFGASFLLFNQNLLIPILIHTFYDFITIIFTWKSALFELKAVEQRSLKEIAGLSFNQIIHQIFDFVDVNDDGFISADEFQLGLKLLGIDWIPYPKIKNLRNSSELFKLLDQNSDKKISYDEFRNLFS